VKFLTKLHLAAIFLISFSQDLRSTSFLEVVTIFSRYLKNPAQVGEIAPISQLAGIELSRYVSKGQAGKRYLEAGGGCGAISVCIARNLRPQDHLDVIEIDGHMCEILKQRLQQYPNVSVHWCSILDWKPEVLYDGIISTLPFNSLGIDFTQEAIAYFEQVAGPGCMFSYVEYPIVRQAVQYFYGSERKRNFRAVQNFLSIVRNKYLVEQAMIYRNVPPVTVYHLCLKP
jgi:phospholipid N-methyltransferase